jgi:hypothetical protein
VASITTAAATSARAGARLRERSSVWDDRVGVGQGLVEMATRRAARGEARGFAAGEEVDDLVGHHAVDACCPQRCGCRLGDRAGRQIELGGQVVAERGGDLVVRGLHVAARERLARARDRGAGFAARAREAGVAHVAREPLLLAPHAAAPANARTGTSCRSHQSADRYGRAPMARSVPGASLMKTMSRPSVSGRVGSARDPGCPPTISGAAFTFADGRTVSVIGGGGDRPIGARGGIEVAPPERRQRHRAVAHRDHDLLEETLVRRVGGLVRLRRIHAQRVAAGQGGRRDAVERAVAADDAANGDGLTGRDVERRGDHLEPELPDRAGEVGGPSFVRERQHRQRERIGCAWKGRDSSKKPLKKPRFRRLCVTRLMLIVAGRR